jgi:hypothetical protein
MLLLFPFTTRLCPFPVSSHLFYSRQIIIWYVEKGPSQSVISRWLSVVISSSSFIDMATCNALDWGQVSLSALSVFFIYHGNCTGPSLPLFSPMTASQVPISRVPLGAQYWPVSSIPKVPSTQVARILAASWGGKAPPSSQNWSKPTPLVISVRMKLGCTMPTAMCWGARSRASNLPNMLLAALEPWWP